MPAKKPVTTADQGSTTPHPPVTKYTTNRVMHVLARNPSQMARNMSFKLTRDKTSQGSIHGMSQIEKRFAGVTFKIPEIHHERAKTCRASRKRGIYSSKRYLMIA
jgi:hypothetical protein